MGLLESVNLAMAEPNPYKKSMSTGINKRPQPGRFAVTAPGPRGQGQAGALADDFIGDPKHHGGSRQALYAFERSDLDAWERKLGRELGNGFFGENLTTSGLDVNGALLGETWRIGDDVVARVTGPRIPCSTFRGWVGESGWLKTFTAEARPGAYLSIERPGEIAAGDPITVLHRPEHDVTISLVYRALTTERELLPRLLAADEYLDDETRATIARERVRRLG